MRDLANAKLMEFIAGSDSRDRDGIAACASVPE
jgi:hypothetical protein